MVTDSDLLGLRALQSLRRLHLPTYVALRYFLDSSAGADDSSWVAKVLPRKYISRTRARFHQVPKFKKLDASGVPEYRDFHIPSPTTAVTESLVLSALAASHAFSKLPNVYSYLWPKHSRSPYNYEHYINGYKSRNMEIAKYAEEHPRHVLIVADIEKFYPNILRSRATVRFRRKLDRSQVPNLIQNTAIQLLDHLFTAIPGQRGIATGPELSHVIGDLALQRVDDVLSKTYGYAYFRYVDDIVIAVPEDSTGKTIELLIKLLGDEELTINRSKTDIVPSDEWIKYGPHNTHRVSPDSFEALVFMLKVYLLKNPDREIPLSKHLKGNGFAIPLERIARVGQSSHFASRVFQFAQRRWRAAIQALFATEKDVIEKAQTVRASVCHALATLLEESIPTGPTRRRWFIQRLRYLTNRAFYLLPPSELGFLIEPLKRIPDFAESVGLLEMLTFKDVNKMLTMPSAALVAGANLLKLWDIGLQVDELPNGSAITAEALSTLLLFDVARIEERLFYVFDDDNNDILRFCAGITPESRVRNDFSFVDEIRCLQISRTATDGLSMIESRFSSQEEVVLDALDIGGEYWS